MNKNSFVITVEQHLKIKKHTEHSDNKFSQNLPACTGSRATRKIGEASKKRSVKAEHATVLDTVPDFRMWSSNPPIPLNVCKDF